MAVAHYLEALAWQRDVVALHTILGGKNPHPNFVVGGVPVAISIWPEHPAAARGRTTAAARAAPRSTSPACSASSR
jgi:hydrogenase large subunit